MKGFGPISKRILVLGVTFMLITSDNQTYASGQHLGLEMEIGRRGLATCPSGEGISQIQRRDTWNYAGYVNFQCVAATLAPSASVYTLSKSTSLGGTALSKINPDLVSAVWSTSFNSYIDGATMVLLKDESKLYITTPNTVDVLLEINATNGNMVQSKSLNGIKSGGKLFLKISSDESTLFYTSFQSVNSNPTVCRLTLSSMTGTCYAFTDMKQIYGFELERDGKVYFYGLNSAAPNNLRYVKFDSLNNAVLWNNVVACSSSSCTAYSATFLLNNQGTLVYVINDNNPPPGKYVMLTAFDVNTGVVHGNRYKTDEGCSLAMGLYLYSTSIYGMFECEVANYLIEYDESSQTITKTYKSKYKFTTTIGGTSGDRLMLIGKDLTSKYSLIISTYTSSVANHPDFNTSISVMDTIPNGVLMPVLTTTATPTTIALNPSSTTITLTPVTYAYEPSVSYIDDVAYQVEAQTIDTLRPNKPFIVTPRMTCSTTGIISIIYILQAYESDPLPLWLSLDPNTGDLRGTAPAVETQTTFSFYVNATVTSTSASSVNLVNLVVKISEDASPFALGMTTASHVMLGATVIVSLSLSAITCQSPRDFWFLFNQLQILLLFLLVDMYIPEDVRYLIETQQFVLVNFLFIPTLDIPGINIIANQLEADQSNQSMADIGYESRSTYNNNLSLQFVFSLIGLVHLVIKLLPTGRPTADGSQSKFRRIWQSTRLKILNMIYYGIYARLLLESFEHLTITSLSELSIFDTSRPADVVSIVFALCVVLFCLFLLVVTICYFFKYFKEFDPEHKFFMMEIFADLRNFRWARLYTPIFLLRRLIFVFTIVILYHGGSIFVLVFCLIIQIIYLCLIVRLRPYSAKYKNVVEILNETYYVIFILIFLIFRAEGMWTPPLIKLLMFLILSNTVTVLCILITALVFTIVSKLRQRARKKNELRYMPETPITAENVNIGDEEEKEEEFKGQNTIKGIKPLDTKNLNRKNTTPSPFGSPETNTNFNHPNYCDGDDDMEMDE